MPKEVKIDDTKLRAFLRLKPSLDDTAAFFDCNPKTIERYIKDNYNITFVEFRDQNMVHTRHRLVQKAIQEALKDKPNTIMLLFCLKNLCKASNRRALHYRQLWFYLFYLD